MSLLNHALRVKDLHRFHTWLVECLVQVSIFAKSQSNLMSYGWQFEISHRNKVLQLSTIALGLRLEFCKDSDLNQTLNQPCVKTVLAYYLKQSHSALLMMLHKTLELSFRLCRTF